MGNVGIPAGGYITKPNAYYSCSIFVLANESYKDSPPSILAFSGDFFFSNMVFRVIFTKHMMTPVTPISHRLKWSTR